MKTWSVGLPTKVEKVMREGAEAAEDRVWKCHPFRILFRSSEASLDVGEMEVC